MKIMDQNRSYIKRDTFDFEIGHLKQSPCLHCTEKDRLPACMKACPDLHTIQSMLAAGISLSRSEEN